MNELGWVDVGLFSFTALLLGLTIGFKLGTSISRGSRTYDQGVKDGIDWARGTSYLGDK